jgi:hypothetical protein
MRNGGEDFRSGQPIDVARYFDEKVDIHHIFPQHWCQGNGVEPQRCDSIVNKTPLSAKTNRIIGGRAPSKYLNALERRSDIDAARMDEILTSHVIAPDRLRADEFDAFFQARAQALLERIQSATGKSADQLAGAAEPQEAPPADYEQLDSDEVTAPGELDPAAATFVSSAATLLDAFEAARGTGRTQGLAELLDAFGTVERSGADQGGK